MSSSVNNSNRVKVCKEPGFREIHISKLSSERLNLLKARKSTHATVSANIKNHLWRGYSNITTILLPLFSLLSPSIYTRYYFRNVILALTFATDFRVIIISYTYVLLLPFLITNTWNTIVAWIIKTILWFRFYSILFVSNWTFISSRILNKRKLMLLFYKYLFNIFHFKDMLLLINRCESSSFANRKSINIAKRQILFYLLSITVSNGKNKNEKWNLCTICATIRIDALP